MLVMRVNVLREALEDLHVVKITQTTSILYSCFIRIVCKERKDLSQPIIF